MWIRLIWIGKGPLANSCGHGSEPKGFKNGRRFYTLALNQLVYDPVILNCHFEHKLHVLSNTAFYQSIVSEDMNMIPSTRLSCAQVLTFG